jgi:hypothetical protein
MPAVNPSALRDKMDSIFADDIKAGFFKRQVESILDFYADRTKRSTTAASALESAERMHVAAPVLRAFCSKIHQRGRRPEDEWLLAATKLWQSKYQEMQLLSVCMLSEIPLDHQLTTASNWAAECDDPRVLESLASEGIQPVRKADPQQVLECVDGWIKAESTRLFGLMVLQQFIDDEIAADLPLIFDLLSGLTSSSRGLEYDGLWSLLEKLAKRSPAESTAFLVDEIKSGDSRTLRFVRGFSDNLPEPFRSQLLAAL